MISKRPALTWKS